MPHRYSSERRIIKAKTKKRKSRKQKKVRSSRKMRKSRKINIIHKNQEGGWPWPWKSNKRVAPEPNRDPNRDSTKTPWWESLYHNPPVSRGVEHFHEYIGTRPDKYSDESVIYDNIVYTKSNIKMARKGIQTVLQNEDEDIIRELKASSPEDYYYYIDGDNPRTIPNTEDKQAYLDELKEEYIKTNDYSTMLQVFANNYRKSQVVNKSYREPYTQYREEILSNKDEIISIRREIKKLLLHNKQQLKGTNFSLFQQYMLNYAGELPTTELNASDNNNSELIKLKEELISTQKDLEELKTLIKSPIPSPE